jgi:DNA-binding XRE family transcriptional regulator
MERRSLTTVLEDTGLMLFTYRVYHKKRVESMAKLVDIAPSTLVRIENGLHPHMRVSTLAELCYHYKIPLFMAFETF